jgi:hypothetical protein
MATQENSVTARLARWALGWAVRHWPEETRPWGLALTAEIDETASAFETVRWSLGGIMFFTRSVLSSAWKCMKLPAGSSLSGRAGGPEASSLLPKRSRVFTAAVLAAAALLLALPEGREAVRTVRAAWDNYLELNAGQRAVKRIADRAEKDNDAQTMAFVALQLEDGERKVELAERAVALDPKLVWILAARRYGQGSILAKPEWPDKAEAADKDNAVPYALAADAAAERLLGTLRRGGHSLREPEVDAALMGDPEWVALMHHAFRAPRYDSYYRRQRELSREVWSREPQLSLTTVVEGLFWWQSTPSPYFTGRFSQDLIRQAEEERAAGHLDRAKEFLQEVNDFGQRMQRNGPGQFESDFGYVLQRKAALGWKAFYEATGQTAEAQAAAQRAAQIDKHLQNVASEGRQRWEDQNHHRGSRIAWIVEISAIVMTIAVLMATLSIGLIELRPSIWKRELVARRILCWTADIAPLTALTMCAAFLASFLPYARLLAEFRADGPGAPNEEPLMLAYWSFDGVTRTIGGADAAVLGWTALTAVLGLVLALLWARVVYRAMRAPASQVQ